MKPCALLFVSALATLLAAPAGARMSLPSRAEAEAAATTDLPPYLQCVPYARQLTGIQIYGDAHTWWDQAEGRYARGYAPRVGAVMAFRPSGNSTLGHVAAVSRVVDKRTILVRHANWSPIEGRRGQIEDNVRVIDVSPANDWSAVRVWFAPIQAMGMAHWPIEGFIYPGRPAPRERLTRHGATLAREVPLQAAADPIGSIITRKMRW